ncbi:hypothetical protein CBR_g286 [Chara braunii]|uniref:Reverse transcriptase domain-containing protein n=1 Tax=Chara braunii TaxID=69332 RepID=A0A388JQB2_CHABU|nr:hypothetical protein CBR_g286 [Chara braunii]|eukprot:GBG59953.1 hypothetical protein CBR_g286 [Chara braunii]
MVHTKSTRTEEGFRNALTMFTLLQNPPGDFPDSLRDETVDMFCQIFERLRDEGRIAEKLVAALNAFLLNQGLNLGDGVASIHASFRDFMVRAWLTTHDRKLKEGLVLYGRLQARLRGVVLLKDEGAIEELLDLVEKELDLSGASALGGSSYRSEDGELGTASKRRKKESLFLRMKEKLLAGKGPWVGAVCSLLRKHGVDIPMHLLVSWIQVLEQQVPSRSPWSAPVLFDRKKDDTLRLCLDYRGLNEYTVRHNYPTPRADDLFDRLSGHHFFTKIDLCSGYHQIRAAEEDQPKPAFRSRFGHYEFTVMPFGLRNAPATFQTAMNTMFQDLLEDSVLVYIDDILVYSRILEEHLTHLRTVLHRLRDHGFYEKLSKCHFAQPKVDFLGHQVSEHGLHMDDSKIQAIVDWPTPTSFPALRSFLGLTNYYGHFLKNYAQYSSQLTPLTCGRLPFHWTPAHEDAFRSLKRLVTSAPVLHLPDYSRPFIVTTDTSDFAIGAVLSQIYPAPSTSPDSTESRLPRIPRFPPPPPATAAHLAPIEHTPPGAPPPYIPEVADDGTVESRDGECPVAYLSRQLLLAERNYTANEREVLALVYAFKKWRHHLHGHTFTVLTDNYVLAALQTMPKLTSRHARWWRDLSEFDFTIKKISGESNQIAYNHAISPATGMSPYYCDLGYHPRVPSDLLRPSQIHPDTKCPALDDWVKEMDALLSKARESIADSLTRMATRANRSRIDHPFKVGDEFIPLALSVPIDFLLVILTDLYPFYPLCLLPFLDTYAAAPGFGSYFDFYIRLSTSVPLFSTRVLVALFRTSTRFLRYSYFIQATSVRLQSRHSSVGLLHFFGVGAVCSLLRKHGVDIPMHLLVSWIQVLEQQVPSILASTALVRTCETPCWVLRCLVELANIWPLAEVLENKSSMRSSTNKLSKEHMKPSQVEGTRMLWRSLWINVTHALPFFAGNAQFLVSCIAATIALP